VIFVTVADTHLSDVNPVSRVDDYHASLMAKMEKVSRVCEKIGATALLHAGDLFHVKKPTRVSHALVTEVADMLRNFPCPVYMVLGNHDISYDRIDTWPRQPVGTLITSGVVRLLSGNPAIFEEEGVRVGIYGQSFLRDYSVPVLDDINRAEHGLTHVLVVAHLFVREKSGTLFGTPVRGYDYFDHADFDVMLLGHDHDDRGVVVRREEGREKFFIDVGALSRGSLDDENVMRQVKCSVVTVEAEKGVKVQQVDLKAAPSEEIFDLEQREAQKRERMQLDGFVDSLKQSLAGVESMDVGGCIAGLDLSERVRDRVVRYIEEAEQHLATSG